MPTPRTVTEPLTLFINDQDEKIKSVKKTLEGVKIEFLFIIVILHSF